MFLPLFLPFSFFLSRIVVLTGFASIATAVEAIKLGASHYLAKPSNTDDIEAAFYDALQAGDLERLMACWADDEDIVCVHPGGPRIVGTHAIRAAFEAMFANGTIAARPERDTSRSRGSPCA